MIDLAVGSRHRPPRPPHSAAAGGFALRRVVLRAHRRGDLPNGIGDPRGSAPFGQPGAKVRD
ncbi:MAG: hypothetical protein K8J09_08880, partial [Planctomycetes bacterium]|nr:hypothetical protein [Planctomycetota bacterium]